MKLEHSLNYTSNPRAALQQPEDNIYYVPPDLKLFNNFLQLLEQNFRSIHEYQFYCNALNQTATRLNSITKYYCQKTIYELIQDRIHEEAKYLLRNTSMSVKQISYELNLCDPSYFGKWFKRREGVTPKKYRGSVYPISPSIF